MGELRRRGEGQRAPDRIDLIEPEAHRHPPDRHAQHRKGRRGQNDPGTHRPQQGPGDQQEQRIQRNFPARQQPGDRATYRDWREAHENRGRQCADDEWRKPRRITEARCRQNDGECGDGRLLRLPDQDPARDSRAHAPDCGGTQDGEQEAAERDLRLRQRDREHNRCGPEDGIEQRIAPAQAPSMLGRGSGERSS